MAEAAAFIMDTMQAAGSDDPGNGYDSENQSGYRNDREDDYNSEA